MAENKENNSFENYEKNLKLQLESKRKDLDNQLTSIIPNQLVLVRLYLWFNTFIISGILTIYLNRIKNFNFEDYQIVLIWVTIFFSLCCIILCFIAILKISNRYFPGDTYEKFAKFETNELEHVNGLNEMINEIFAAYKGNDKIIHNAARFLRWAFHCNFLSLVFFIIFIIILVFNLWKGGEKMADDKKVDKPVASMTGKPNIVQTSNISQESHRISEGLQDKIIANKNQPKPEQNQSKNKK